MISSQQDLYTFILLGILFACALGVILVGVWIYRNSISSRKAGRLSQYVGAPPDEQQVVHVRRVLPISDKDIGKFRDWINKSLRRLSSEKLLVKISSAYWPITDTEYILMRFLATALSVLLGSLIFKSILGGIFLAVIVYLLPPIFLERAIAQRQRQFHTQLLDVLVLIKGAVQAGYSLMQGLDLAVKEIPAPAAEEFGRVLYEINLGLSMEDALFNLAERMESDDLQIVVTAIIINAQVGGNLSTVLEATISTIRDRMHLQGEIRSLTSYARYVGNFLTFLPFITALIIFLVSPDYFVTVRSSLLTQVIFIMAMLGVVIGNIWIRRIVKIKV